MNFLQPVANRAEILISSSHVCDVRTNVSCSCSIDDVVCDSFQTDRTDHVSLEQSLTPHQPASNHQ